MLQRVRQRLSALFGRDDADTESEKSGFAGSTLDWSINYSHGVDNSEAAREMAEIQEQADILDDEEFRN